MKNNQSSTPRLVALVLSILVLAWHGSGVVVAEKLAPDHHTIESRSFLLQELALPPAPRYNPNLV